MSYVPCPQFADWDSLPLALTDGAANRPKLRSVTATAAREGVRAGMTLAEARALCAKLEARVWDDAAIGAAITRATARFVEVSPQVAPVVGAPGMWWLGASGFAPGSRAAGGDSEHAFAAALQRIAQEWHPRARVAIAATCVAARAATWAGASFGSSTTRSLITVIPCGADAQYIARAPLTLLPIEDEMREALRALGIRTIGQFADLDPGDVEQRWSDAGLVAWRLARGDDPRRPVLARFDEHPHVEMELATPAATMEPVLFLVRPALENLVTQLVAQGRAIAALAITLTLDDARGPMPSAQPHTVTREIRLPRPLARVLPLFERSRGLLARWQLTAPVTAVRLTVVLTGALTGEQGNLLDTSWRDPGAADAALERLRAELGPDVVVSPRARDGYTPERSGAWFSADAERSPASEQFSAAASRPVKQASFAGFTAPKARRELTRGSAAAENSMAFRLLQSPEKVDVDRDPPDSPDPLPRRIVWRGRAIHVVNAVGPERLSGDWWKDSYGRDYWRCESEDDHGELVLYRDATGWWLQGWYD
jgi:protein ImuB